MGSVRVEVDPERERLDGRLARATPAADRAAPLGHERPRPAAERRDLERLAEPREARDPQPQPPQDPHAAAVEPRVDDVGEGGVLQPAGDRVEARPPGRRDVGQAGRDRVPEHPPVGRRRNERVVRQARR